MATYIATLGTKVALIDAFDERRAAHRAREVLVKAPASTARPTVRPATDAEVAQWKAAQQQVRALRGKSRKALREYAEAVARVTVTHSTMELGS